MSAKLLPFPVTDGGFRRRYREWRPAFENRPLREQRPPARVLGIDRLRWRRYGEWRFTADAVD